METVRAAELRINNWIKDGNDFEQVTIYHLDCLIIGRCEFDPIPLTEEWLLKFLLFKLIDNRDKWFCEDKGMFSFNGKIHCSDYFIATNDFKIFHLCIATIDDGMESWEYLTELKYVHQLQNLYFALTGKELLLSLPQ